MVESPRDNQWSDSRLMLLGHIQEGTTLNYHWGINNFRGVARTIIRGVLS